MNSYKDNHRFIQLLVPENQHDQESIDPLTHSLPSASLVVSQEANAILSKVRDTLAVVSAVGFSSEFFALAKNILMLEQFKSEAEQKQGQSYTQTINEIYLYSKIEVGLSKPFEWIYTELMIRDKGSEQPESPIRLNYRQSNIREISKIQQIISADLIISGVVIFELSKEKHIDQLIKIITLAQQKTTQFIHSVIPVFVLLYSPSIYTEQSIQQVLQPFIRMGISFHLIEQWQQQNMGWNEQHRLIGSSKTISNILKPKIMDRGSLTPKFIVQFLNTYMGEHEDQVTIYSSWHKTQHEQADQQAQNALSEYVSKIQEITGGKTLLGVGFFKQMEAKVRGQIIRQVSQRAILSGERQEIIKTQRKLLECREELQSKNQWSILSWGRDFLKQSYSSVQKKIGKQIKSLPLYRQQMYVFLQFYKKKSEQYLTLDLSIFFQDFLFTKIFEAVQQIHQAIVAQHQQQSKVLQNQITSLLNQNKQIRRKGNKEESEAQRRCSQFKQKNMLLQTRCGLLEKSGEELKEQLQEAREKYQQKINQIGQNHYSQLKVLREECEKLRDTEQNFNKQMALLECELSKEKLLHEQTQSYFKEVIEGYKDKQVQIKDQLQQISMNTSREMNMLKQSSCRQIQDYSLSNTEMKCKINELQLSLKQKQSQMAEMKVELQNVKLSSNAKLEKMGSKLSDLELRNKMLEEREVQCDILRNKLKKNQEDTKRVLREKDQQTELYKEAEKQNLITTQKYAYLQENLAEQKQKLRQFDQNYKKLKNQKDELQNKINVSHKKVYVDEWIQVQDKLQKQKLKTALQIIRELESQYNRIKAEFEWSKRTAHHSFRPY